MHLMQLIASSTHRPYQHVVCNPSMQLISAAAASGSTCLQAHLQHLGGLTLYMRLL
jgi:hypothetical protein